MDNHIGKCMRNTRRKKSRTTEKKLEWEAVNLGSIPNVRMKCEEK